jgi:D-lactate dehydrogenase (cytochrome)
LTGLAGGYYLSKFSLELSPPENLYPSSSTASLSAISVPVYAKGSTLKDGFKQIEKVLQPDQISYKKEDFANYALDASIKSAEENADLIVYPKSTEEVSAVLKIAHSYRIPVFPISGNTSLEGQRSITKNGVILDLSGFDKIIKINEEDSDIVVQPAVNWTDLNEALNEKGLFYPPVPGPGGQVGGFINTSSSSPNSVKYGSTRENVLNLTVVLADGTVVKTKNRPVKSSAGYNLTGLFIGSEGTLGVITEATLKVHAKPKYERITVASFPTLKDATNAISSLKKQNLKAEEVQLIDSNLIDVVNQSGISKNQLPVNPTLFIKITDNDENVLKSQLKSVESIVKAANSSKVSSSWNDSSSKELWSPIKLVYPASFKYAKPRIAGAKLYHSLDVTVPVSNLAQLIEETTKEINSYEGIYIGGYSRSDAGNFLPIVLYDPAKKAEIEKINTNLQKRALKLDGSISGQYGIGLSKRELLNEEFGIEGVDLQRKLKLALDPLRILNPGKVFKVDPAEK